MERKITKDIIVSDLLKIDMNICAILMASGMHMLGDPSYMAESLGNIALLHGTDPDRLVDMINEYLASKSE